jgi:hypothetical protein
MGRHSLSVSCCGILTSLFGITEMNERIKELAEQCTSWSEGSTWTSREVFDKEKFAELIVKECADYLDNFNKAIIGDVGIAGFSLKKHFGVRE